MFSSRNRNNEALASLSKNKRYTHHQAVVHLDTPQPEACSAIVQDLRERMGRVNVEVDKRADGMISRVTVPRTFFRRVLRQDIGLRSLIANSDVEVDETRTKGWIRRRIVPSGRRKGSVYVKEIKNLKEEEDLSSMNSLDTAAFVDWMKDFFTEEGLKTTTWVVTMGGVALIGWLIIAKTTGMIEAYADQTAAMLNDDKGLAEAVRRRAGQDPAATMPSVVSSTGTRPQPAQAKPAQSRPSSGTKPTDAGKRER